MEQLVRRAARLNGFVRVDMESSAYTERTLDWSPSFTRDTGPWAS